MLGHTVDLLRSRPEKITLYMWGDPLQGSHIQIMSYMWGEPHYKVPIFLIKYGGTIRVIDSYKVPTLYMWGDPITRFPHSISGMGRPSVIDSYKVPTHHIRYWGTIRVIDSYKVPTVDSNHEDTSHWQLQGSRSGVSLPPRTEGFNFFSSSAVCVSLLFTEASLLGYTTHLKVLIIFKNCGWSIGRM